MTVWTVESNSINREVMFTSPITIDDITSYARSKGYKKFTVKDMEGNLLSQADFPFEGSLTVEPYNEAA